MPASKTYVSAIRKVLGNSESKIESVARIDGDGGVLVKLSHGSDGLVKRIRETFPLSAVSLCEDMVGGSICTNVLFPAEDVQRRDAVLLASGTPSALVLSVCCRVLFWFAVLLFLVSLFLQ